MVIYRDRFPRPGTWLGLVLCAAAPAVAAGQASGPAGGATVVPITAEPSHHIALTNSRVRVFDVTAGPHASTLVHRHEHDYLFVTLGAADITSSRPGAPPARLTLADGAVEYAPGHFAHAVSNNLDRPFHNITIELLRPATGVTPCHAACEQPQPCARTAHCGTDTRLYSADQWVVDAITLEPGGRWEAAPGSGPRLVVLASDAELTLGGNFESVETAHRAAGNLIWMPVARPGRTRAVSIGSHPAPVASITNAGPRTARLVILDWTSRP